MRTILPLLLLLVPGCGIPKDGTDAAGESADPETGGADSRSSDSGETADTGGDTSPPDGPDEDGDGWSPDAGDCDDLDASVNPGAAEIACDGVDSDCDGAGPSAVAAVGTVEYDSFQEALDAAADGDVVEVCPGTWEVSGLTVSKPSQRLTLRSWSGSAEDTVFQGDGASRILYLQQTSAVRVEDLTFTGGAARDTDTGGGAILAINTALSVSGCVFRDNTSDDEGGAVYVYAVWEDQGPLIERSTFVDNRAEEAGGAILVYGETEAVGVAAVIDASTFEGNTASQEGGAVGLHHLGLELSASTFSSNGTPNKGAVQVSLSSEGPAGDVVVTDTTFQENTSGSSGAGGLEVYVNYGSTDIAISGSTFRDNDGGAAGGLKLYVSTGAGPVTLRVTDSTFANNAGAYGGGANLSVEPGTDVEIDGVTFTGNVGGTEGGAVVFNVSGDAGEASLTVTDSVFSGNSSSQSSAAIFAHGDDDVTTTVSVTDTVMEDNESSRSIGAFWAYGAFREIALDAVTIEGNTGYHGGGVLISSGEDVTATLNAVTLSDNASTHYGGAALNISSTGTFSLTDTTIDGNAFEGSDVSWGAAIAVLKDGAEVTMEGGSVTSNAGPSAGGLYLTGGSFSATGVDWGAGTTDNSPSDVYGCEDAYGDDATFSVTADGCAD